MQAKVKEKVEEKAKAKAKAKTRPLNLKMAFAGNGQKLVDAAVVTNALGLTATMMLTKVAAAGARAGTRIMTKIKIRTVGGPGSHRRAKLPSLEVSPLRARMTSPLASTSLKENVKRATRATTGIRRSAVTF